MIKPKPHKNKKPKIVEKKLGREQAYGQVWNWDDENPLIEIDHRLKNQDRLCILTHEALHCAFPGMSEKSVIRAAKLVSSVLWSDNYRKVEQ